MLRTMDIYGSRDADEEDEEQEEVVVMPEDEEVVVMHEDDVRPTFAITSVSLDEGTESTTNPKMAVVSVEKAKAQEAQEAERAVVCAGLASRVLSFDVSIGVSVDTSDTNLQMAI
jgi:hypothetical protein